MPYLIINTKRKPNRPKWEDVLLGKAKNEESGVTWDSQGLPRTITRWYDEIPAEVRECTDVGSLRAKLQSFCDRHSDLIEADKDKLYNTWYIPKANGKRRRIDEPKPELMAAQDELKRLFEKDFHALAHAAAYAYVKKRSCVNGASRHTASKWFLKIDMKDFFGSVNEKWTLKQLENVWPFSAVAETEDGERLLRNALSVCFRTVEGGRIGLPQGSPISPLLSNLVMVDVDYRLSKALKDTKIVYTRYADDMIFSRKDTFNHWKLIDLIRNEIRHTPLLINGEKTVYRSREKSSNWVLGCMLNAEGKTTIGHEAKRYLKAKVHHFIMEHVRNNAPWSPQQRAELRGLMAWYENVEPLSTFKIIENVCKKQHLSPWAVSYVLKNG